jgi:hypothetical protein
VTDIINSRRRCGARIMESNMIMWKVLDDVVAMNNECVAQLNDGNLMEGLFVLQRAVSVVRDAAAMFSATPPEAPITPLQSPPMTLRSDAPPSSVRHQFRFKSRDWSLSLAKQSPVGDTLAMHSAPLILYLSNAPSIHGTTESNSLHLIAGKDDSVVFTLFSAAILFNLALVCHRLGMVYGRDTSVIRASKLYMVIVELLNDSTAPSTMEDAAMMSTTRSSTHVFLLTLVLNNLGHAQYELCNYPGYHRCMITLRNLLANTSTHDCINYIDHSDGSNDSIMVGILDEIRLNILFWNFSPPSVAHAA